MKCTEIDNAIAERAEPMAINLCILRHSLSFAFKDFKIYYGDVDENVTSGFRVKIKYKMKDSHLYGHVVDKTANVVIFTSVSCRVRQKYFLKCVLHMKNDNFSLFDR